MYKTETLMQYFNSIRELANRCDSKIDEASIIQYVINGIDGPRSYKIILYGAASFSEFKQKLRTYETVIKNMGIHTSNSPNFRHSYESRGRDFKQQSFQRKPTRFNVSDAAKNPQRCFNCNDIGHLSKSCSNHSRGPRCLLCNLYGHKSFECRRANLNSISTPPSGVNAVHELPSPINMCKDVTIFGRKLNGQVVVVKKKDGKSRVCIDYRRLNRKLIKDNYPLPLIDDILDCLQNAKIFTTLDLKNGFFHVTVNERSRKFTSFVTHNGQYQFRRMPFGLSTCPSTFMRYINAIFRHLISKSIVLPYMDDVVIPAANESQALEYLKIVLQVKWLCVRVPRPYGATVAQWSMVMGSWQACHEFELSTTKDPPYFYLSFNIPNECDSNQISHVAVKPPLFWKHNPALWFVRLAAQVDLAKILNDATKFNCVLSAVESDILNSVSDLVLKPPENKKYEALKKRLIEVHSESEDSKIRTLLQGLELGDQRPSQLLTRMRSLTGDNVGEPLLKSLWLGRLPNGTQPILAALNENLNQLATVADKINDLTFSQGINSVVATSEKNP
ncbi:hypothetical protein TNCV_2123101 [Trichonephila clavipes]|nr:hypothetical protein TNCV_2123101 [Trichonephila clavipes]